MTCPTPQSFTVVRTERPHGERVTRHSQHRFALNRTAGTEGSHDTDFVSDKGMCCGRRKDGKRKDSMLEQDTQKKEMEIGTENRHFTKRQMVEKGCWLEPWTEHKIQDQQSDRETKKNMGR